MAHQVTSDCATITVAIHGAAPAVWQFSGVRVKMSSSGGSASVDGLPGDPPLFRSERLTIIIDMPGEAAPSDTATAMALAWLRGDRAAALAMADLLQEEHARW